MMQSESIGKLATALAAAQAVMKAPKKGRTAKIESERRSYSYSYADLADVIECYREPLTKNGLAVAQTMAPVDGHLVMTTKLLHSSGEWLSSDYPIAAFARPQEQGSAITYARRYAVTALLGIAAEDDDDGERAQHAAERHEDHTEVPPIVAKMYAAADEIGQHTGKDRETVIREASAFQKDGKTLSFADPMKKLGSTKWMESTLGRLEKEAHKLRAMKEPGAAEAAEAFTSGLETAPCCGGEHAPSAPCPKGAAA